MAWVQEHSACYQQISIDAVWQTLTDINHWADWHDDLEYCSMEGAFKTGNVFTLKPKGAPSVNITLTSVTPKKSFTDCTTFIGAKMIDTHTLEETDEGVRISNRLEVAGPLKWLWIALVARHVAKTVPDEIDALVRKVRKINA